MDCPCPLLTLAGAVLLSAAVVPASAQTFQPDAEGYPCARRPQLAIVQSGLGFSIREKAVRNVPATAPTAIKIGNSLTLDSRLFAHTSLVRPEPNHAPQR